MGDLQNRSKCCSDHSRTFVPTFNSKIYLVKINLHKLSKVTDRCRTFIIRESSWANWLSYLINRLDSPAPYLDATIHSTDVSGLRSYSTTVYTLQRTNSSFLNRFCAKCSRMQGGYAHVCVPSSMNPRDSQPDSSTCLERCHATPVVL